jgi:hypothetical protein
LPEIPPSGTLCASSDPQARIIEQPFEERKTGMKAVLAEQPTYEEARLTEKLERFLLTRPETPFLAVDLDVIKLKYRELRHYFPTASIRKLQEP